MRPDMRPVIILALAALPMACSQITHRGIEIPRTEVISTAEAQRFLLVTGYDTGRVDGIRGPRTQAALAAFAGERNLAPDLTPETSHQLRREALRGDGIAGIGESLAVLAAQTRFASVPSAQRRLRELGYAPGPIDGILGPRTSSALIAFQRDRNLPVTGTLTAETAAALEIGT